jgi:hypothetical protein
LIVVCGPAIAVADAAAIAVAAAVVVVVVIVVVVVAVTVAVAVAVAAAHYLIVEFFFLCCRRPSFVVLSYPLRHLSVATGEFKG